MGLGAAGHGTAWRGEACCAFVHTSLHVHMCACGCVGVLACLCVYVHTQSEFARMSACVRACVHAVLHAHESEPDRGVSVA